MMLLVGQKEIAAYCRVTTRTIKNWIRYYAFPAGTMPDGRSAASEFAIEEWLRLRRQAIRNIKERKRLSDE